jgi:hypothetical protein
VLASNCGVVAATEIKSHHNPTNWNTVATASAVMPIVKSASKNARAIKPVYKAAVMDAAFKMFAPRAYHFG